MYTGACYGSLASVTNSAVWHTLMTMNETLPVTIVTGFLGAGKTTLVNRWLSRVQKGDIAVIVNEYGDVGIDGELLARRASVLLEVSGGCVCCTTQRELVDALDTIASAAVPPQRILIETSGAASPAGVLRAIMGGGRNGRLVLDGVVTVFDATRVDDVLEHDLAREQLGYADVVVLSHADRCTPERQQQVITTLVSHNGAAAFVESAREEDAIQASDSLDAVLALRRLGFIAPQAPATASAHVYESISLVLDGDVDGERFADFMESELAEFAGRIFRVKGVLAVAGLAQRMIVQGVADAVEVTFGEAWDAAPRTSRLVVVGFGLEREALSRGFDECRVERCEQS